LGIGYYNVRADAEKARQSYEKAFQADSADARVFYERDQLYKRLGVTAEERLAEMERHLNLVTLRDDLSVELAALYNQTGKPAKAVSVLSSRHFQPWEGGEGLALSQHVRSHLALARQALCDNNPKEALTFLESALACPHNLGEAKHLLASQSNLYFWLGIACSALGRDEDAKQWWMRATLSASDFQEMSVKPYSEMTFYHAMALKKLGLDAEARSLLLALRHYASELAVKEPNIDYFATSLPTMLLFREDLRERNRVTAVFLEAQAALGLGERESALRLLDEVLAADPNHAWARDLLQEMACDLVFENQCTEA
jgi:tetratricopeptide (TPR) repeat protein